MWEWIFIIDGLFVSSSSHLFVHPMENLAKREIEIIDLHTCSCTLNTCTVSVKIPEKMCSIISTANNLIVLNFLLEISFHVPDHPIRKKNDYPNIPSLFGKFVLLHVYTCTYSVTIERCNEISIFVDDCL